VFEYVMRLRLGKPINSAKNKEQTPQHPWLRS
jgi:hypothetical protein